MPRAYVRRSRLFQLTYNVSDNVSGIVTFAILGRTTDWIRAILTTDYAVERATKFECCVIRGHLKETN
jgi:hypothetical protein